MFTFLSVQGCYMTIHITPEPEFSYVSFESNVAASDYGPLITRVIETFQPGKFVVTVFANKVKRINLLVIFVFTTFYFAELTSLFQHTRTRVCRFDWRKMEAQRSAILSFPDVRPDIRSLLQVSELRVTGNVPVCGAHSSIPPPKRPANIQTILPNHSHPSQSINQPLFINLQHFRNLH